MVEIRKETSSDLDEIRFINDMAFGGTIESSIVDKLRSSCDEIISLVAVTEDKIAGHILFSPAAIETPSGKIAGMGLAPMAVLPGFQNRGIGSMLVKEGLRIVKEMNVPFIIVLGHEKYYPRFGFEKASRYGIKCQWNGVPDEVFMILILDENKMKGVSGTARYRNEFKDAV